MAAPNLINISSVTGKITGNVLTTSNSTLVVNAALSNNLVKINYIVISNANGTSSADVTFGLLKNNVSTFFISYTINVPADSTFVAATKDMQIYLEENDSLYAYASANSVLQSLVSYDLIR